MIASLAYFVLTQTRIYFGGRPILFKIFNLILIEIRGLLCENSSYQVVIPSVADPDEDEGISLRVRITRDADCILPASHARSASIQITPIARNLATKA